MLSDPDRVNDFRLLENELYLTATDLDTCERIVLGGAEWDDVPISRAVAASTALPMVYKPVEIKGRHLIDGGLRSTTNVDVAVEPGAEFVIVVNPLVPYVNDFQKVIPTMCGSRVRRVRDMGFPQIGYQAFKLLAHQRLHEAVRHWKERYPGVDIILIEPDPNDELMFETNILNFTRRVEIARHGFESVTLKLASEYDDLEGDLRQARHRDLGHARPQGRAQVRPRARARRRLAPHPRADDRGAAAAVRRGLAGSAAGPEDLRQPSDEGQRLLGELPPGHAQHPPARGAELRVPQPVLLEGSPRRVVAVAVDLDREALLAPRAVHQMVPEAHVQLGSGQSRRPHEREEALLRFRAREGRILLALQQRAQPAAPVAADGGLQLGDQVAATDESVDERLVEGPFQVAIGLHVRQIEQRARGGRDGDAAAGGEVVVGEHARPMDA